MERKIKALGIVCGNKLREIIALKEELSSELAAIELQLGSAKIQNMPRWPQMQPIISVTDNSQSEPTIYMGPYLGIDKTSIIMFTDKLCESQNIPDISDTPDISYNLPRAMIFVYTALLSDLTFYVEYARKKIDENKRELEHRSRYNTIALGANAIAMGHNNITIGDGTVNGDIAHPAGMYSVAIGNSATATAANTIAIGNSSIANIAQVALDSANITGVANTVNF